MNSHLTAQRAVVRMMFDPQFAAAVRQDPERVLAEVPAALRAQLVALDPRAFGLDPLRRRRVLRVLAEEWKGTITLMLAETRSLAVLEGFFSSTAFHRSVEERGSMPLAFAQWVGEQIADGKLKTAALAGVLQIETAVARARRAIAAEVLHPGSDQTLRPADGVFLVDVTTGAMAALNGAEKYLFEVGLMPAVALCDDAPRLALDARAQDSTVLHLITVPHEGSITLVTIEGPTAHLLRAFEGRSRTPDQVIADAVARGVAEPRARQLLDELIAGEIVVPG